MRILMVTPFLPTAGSVHGGGTYLHALVEALAGLADVHLVSFATGDELESGARPAGGVASARIVFRTERGDRATWAAGIGRQANMLRRWSWSGLPVTVAKFASTTLRRVLTDAVGRVRPDVALFEMDLMAAYLDAVGDLPTILTDHEAADAVPAAVGPAGLGRARDTRLWRRYFERYARADRLQALNDEDAAHLAARFGRDVAVRPAVVRIPAERAAPDRAPPRALFFGDFRHRPNPEAARFLIDAVLPRLRTPGARLTIAGRGSEQLLSAGPPADPRLEVLGFVDDLGALLDSARVVVAPVFSGSGTRIKILTAMARGLPVVANDLGLRGLAADAAGVTRAETAADCAAAIDACCADPAAAAHAGGRARDWISNHLAPDAVARVQLRAIEALLAARRRNPDHVRNP